MSYPRSYVGAAGRGDFVPVGHAVSGPSSGDGPHRDTKGGQTRMFARTSRYIAVGTLLLASLAACGESGSSGTSAPPTGAAAGAGCAPIADDTLVLLTDDKNLQSSDNIIAAINAAKST